VAWPCQSSHPIPDPPPARRAGTPTGFTRMPDIGDVSRSNVVVAASSWVRRLTSRLRSSPPSRTPVRRVETESKGSVLTLRRTGNLAPNLRRTPDRLRGGPDAQGGAGRLAAGGREAVAHSSPRIASISRRYFLADTLGHPSQPSSAGTRRIGNGFDCEEDRILRAARRGCCGSQPLVLGPSPRRTASLRWHEERDRLDLRPRGWHQAQVLNRTSC
jgi:hypothetical protein